MTFVPDNELKEPGGVTLAPMIDFLFLMLAIFASLAVTRVAFKDTFVDLVKSKKELSSSVSENPSKMINITISENGEYKWVTEIRDHALASAEEIAEELLRQYQRGLLPEDKHHTHILLRIDKNARWESVLHALLAIKEAGFNVHPVYEPEY